MLKKLLPILLAVLLTLGIASLILAVLGADLLSETLSKFDAIFLGAVGAPGVPDHISLWDLLLVIRKSSESNLDTSFNRYNSIIMLLFYSYLLTYIN